MTHLNEAYKSNTLKGFLLWAQTCAKEDKEKRYWDILFIANGESHEILYVTPEGEIRKSRKTVPLGDIQDSQIYLDKFFTGKDKIKSVIKTDDVTTKTLCNLTAHAKTSCLVIIPDKNSNGVPTSVMFIEGSGTKAIMDMLNKHKEREDNQKDPKLTDRQQKIAEWRKMYNNIKQKFNEYKEKNGEKEAMQISKTVNSLSENPDLIKLMKQNVGDISKTDIQAYLYAFLLDFEDRFGFLLWMKKDKRFRKLYKTFHPDVDMDKF